MKAILEFNLPEDDFEYKVTSKALDYHYCFLRIDKWLREVLKYRSDLLTPEEYEAYEACSKEISTTLTEAGINLYDP